MLRKADACRFYWLTTDSPSSAGCLHYQSYIVEYLGRHKCQHFFPDWEMLRGLDARRVPLLATDLPSSDWPCALLSTAVNYLVYYLSVFDDGLPSNHPIAPPIFFMCRAGARPHNLRVSLCPSLFTCSLCLFFLFAPCFHTPFVS